MIYDVNGNVLPEDKVDLTKGYISYNIVIKKDAEPIDNITKFAWNDNDYEEVQVYTPFPKEKLEAMQTPSADEDRDAMLVDIEYRLTILELGL